MNILGISAFYHDSAAALIRDGIPLAAAQEERFTRKKNDASFPTHAIKFCLKEAKLNIDELDWVVFYEKPLRKFERILITHLKHFPYSYRAFPRAMFLWLGDRLWMKNRIAKELGIPPGKILFTEHHQSHAASAYYPSPFNDAAILTIDGVGEWATTTFSKGKNNHIKQLSELYFPHSLGLLYSAITAFLGFRVNEGEQKVMGLAAYGSPKYQNEIASLIHFSSDGSFELDISAFRYPFDPDKSFGKKIISLLGEPRDPKQPVQYNSSNALHADIAASLQAVLEDGVISLANSLYQQYPTKNLCFAGGVALNVVANSKILEKTPFENIFIQPAPGDARGALGCALYAYHLLLNKSRSFIKENVYLGEKAITTSGAIVNETPNQDILIEKTVNNIISNKTVGWVQGRFEWGPRSLGNRSLLADARNIQMKHHINKNIKKRELFRPFAPAITKEAANDFFDIPKGGLHCTPYMLISVNAKKHAINTIPAALHIDNSARIQIVSKESNPVFHKLITAFEKETDIPVLLNTSLNLQGEPIVRTEEDALSVFKRSQIDALVINNQIYNKQ